MSNVNISEDLQLYLQRKAELEAGCTRYELHAEKLRREIPADREILELPAEVKKAELAATSFRLPELGDCGHPGHWDALHRVELAV